MPRPQRTLPPGAVHARRAGIFLLLGALGVNLPLPWTGIALVPLSIGAVESIRALKVMRAAHAPARSVVWALFGLVLTVMLAGAVALPYAFYDTTKGYQECMLGANTSVAAAQCQTSLYDGLQSVLGGWAPVRR